MFFWAKLYISLKIQEQIDYMFYSTKIRNILY